MRIVLVIKVRVSTICVSFPATYNSNKVGKSVTFVDVSIERSPGRQGRLEATTVAEVTVSKCMYLFSFEEYVLTLPLSRQTCSMALVCCMGVVLRT